LYGRIPSPEESSVWLNLNSFAARLNREGLVDATCLALFELLNALEEKNPVREAASCNISTASEWVIRSGVKLYSEARNEGPHKDETWLTRRGPLYDGKTEHWQFWMLRFSEVEGEVDEEAAKRAQQAVGAMKKVEKVIKKLKRDLDLSTDEEHPSSLQVTKDWREWSQ
jgi:uncharacterized protein DUF3632